MDTTLAQILQELYRLVAETDRLNRMVSELQQQIDNAESKEPE